jgi:hypothetical protein
MVSAVYPEWLGAIRNPWRARSRWQIALLFMHTISIAQSMVQRLFHSLAGFMGAGSHLICLGHSKVSPTAATGEFIFTLYTCFIHASIPNLCNNKT